MKRCTFCDKEHDRPQETCSKSCSLKVSNRRKYPKSQKACVICGAAFEVEFLRRDNVTCTRKCAKGLADRSIDKVATGRKISETRLRRGAQGLIVYHGHRHSPETLTHLRSLFSDGRRRGSGNSMFGRKHREASKDAMSDTKSRKIAAGEYDKSKWAKRGEAFAAKAQRLIPYRSSWELRAIEILEADPTVESFKFEPVRIPYLYGSGDDSFHKRHYVPDFLVTYSDGRRVMVEVKPKCYVGTAVNRAKAEAAREYCFEVGASFEFWTQKRLGL